MNKTAVILIAVLLSITIAFTVTMYYCAKRQVVALAGTQADVNLNRDFLKLRSFHLSLSHIFWFEFATYDASGHETGSYFYWRLLPFGQIDIASV